MATKFSTTKENRMYEDLMTCKICLKYYDDPRLLPCSHTYCFQCIRKEISGINGNFTCPMNDGTTIQRNQITSLRANHAIREVIESQANISSTTPKDLISKTFNKSSSDAKNEPNDLDNSHISEQNEIYITGLPLDMPDHCLHRILRKEFMTVGLIKNNKNTGIPCIDLKKDEAIKTKFIGSATIVFMGEESVAKAIAKYDGERVSSLNNAQIYVKKSESKTSFSNRGPKTSVDDATEIKFWFQFEGGRATKKMLKPRIDVDDLINAALNGEDSRGSYQAYYRNQLLEPGQRAPSDTSDTEPIIISRISIPKPTPKYDTPARKHFHIVIDHSNIFLGAQNIPNEHGLFRRNLFIRLDIKNLARVLELGKLPTEIKTRIASGTTASKDDRVWTEWKSYGYNCIVGQRYTDDESVDSMLHDEISSILYSNDNSNTPKVLVLVTGDVYRNFDQTSFSIIIETALTKNWNVEIWSWKQSLNQVFIDTQRQYESQMIINYLDSYRNEVTFEKKPRQN